MSLCRSSRPIFVRACRFVCTCVYTASTRSGMRSGASLPSCGWTATGTSRPGSYKQSSGACFVGTQCDRETGDGVGVDGSVQCVPHATEVKLHQASRPPLYVCGSSTAVQGRLRPSTIQAGGGCAAAADPVPWLAPQTALPALPWRPTPANPVPGLETAPLLPTPQGRSAFADTVPRLVPAAVVPTLHRGPRLADPVSGLGTATVVQALRGCAMHAGVFPRLAATAVVCAVRCRKNPSVQPAHAGASEELRAARGGGYTAGVVQVCLVPSMARAVPRCAACASKPQVSATLQRSESCRPPILLPLSPRSHDHSPCSPCSCVVQAPPCLQSHSSCAFLLCVGPNPLFWGRLPDCRRWLLSRVYQRWRRCVLVLQCAVRQFLARQKVIRVKRAAREQFRRPKKLSLADKVAKLEKVRDWFGSCLVASGTEPSSLV